MNDVIYAPYVPKTTGVIINGIKVWDHRWYINILLKIKLFFMPSFRKRVKTTSNIEVDAKMFIPSYIDKINVDLVI